MEECGPAHKERVLEKQKCEIEISDRHRLLIGRGVAYRRWPLAQGLPRPLPVVQLFSPHTASEICTCFRSHYTLN